MVHLLVMTALLGQASALLPPEVPAQGWTIVLPGIEGRSILNAHMAEGLQRGGVQGVIEVIDWTTGHFPLFLVHLRDIERNRQQAEAIAERIVQYQQQYPGKPVHLVGHSGGGGMILLILACLPPSHQVATATLIAPAVSPEYPLDAALDKVTHGMWCYYSPFDVPLLVTGTTIAGTFDGKHRPSAGAFGFRCDDPRLVQIRWSPAMLRDRHLAGHFGCTSPTFISRWVAPHLVQASAAQ